MAGDKCAVEYRRTQLSAAVLIYTHSTGDLIG